ncbi:MAG: aminotransferase class III-fold pyridoxal phosphate-dependent enzyme [Planctomycetes bacterium]|nr:aminotransferase class III-fold pyridoxal phosphate-dependent enzyme [Planctomycetota bacterium]
MTALEELRRDASAESTGTADVMTRGLDLDTIRRFVDHDSRLGDAIVEALALRRQLVREFPDVLTLSEREQIAAIQSDIVNFYADDAVNPYVALAAKGPWIITTTGAVVHDAGGYGMIGFGHAPEAILAAMGGTQVMANVMTANLSQLRLTRALKREVGHRRGSCPYSRFIFMNSGSESVTVAARISDVNAKAMTDPGGRYAGRTCRKVALSGGFHGRTDQPARFSDSTRRTYQKYLASFRESDLWTVEPNDVDALREVFARAAREKVFIEALFMEPVMGEGNPGHSTSREFYDLARQLTLEHGTLLLIDSIQAGLRAHGCLSIVDYPGFEGIEPPDFETYSKALNAGQYPLSVLALTERTAGLYRKGIYGNTMTGNPRAMDVAVAVLQAVTPELRANIRRQGATFVAKLNELKEELGGAIVDVQGTGLLFSCELARGIKAYGEGSVEESMRKLGVSVIHGGENSLRYTPYFGIRDAEVDLIIDATRQALIGETARV